MKGVVIAIDAGYANFGWVVIRNGNWRRPEKWRNERLLTKFSEDALYGAIYKWCQTNKAILDEATAIILERQMMMKFAVMNTVIRTLYHDKTEIRNPKTVGAYFGLPVNREEKKRAAVSLVKRMGCEIPRMKKQDDLADAMLMAVNYLGDENPETVIGWRAVK